jgi:biopolymer transport protein ExbD
MHASDAGDEPITGINVTPLVDIVLVLLIIFMAVAPAISRRAVKVEVPKVAASDKAATEALPVALNARRELTLSGRPTTLEELKRVLSVAARESPNQAVTLAADKGLPYGEVAELLDAIRASGIRKVGLEVRRK